MSLNDTYFLIPAHLELARARYFRKGDDGEPIEHDIKDVFRREVGHIYQNDPEHQKEALKLRYEKKIVPAGRPMAQAGTGTSNLCNCFVLGFEDDTKEAISDLKTTHMNIQAQGGGCVHEDTPVYIQGLGILPIREVPEFQTLEPDGQAHDLGISYQTISYNQLMDLYQNDTITHFWKFQVAAQDVRHVQFESGVITTSAWHPFLVVQESKNKFKVVKKRADELTKDDLVLSLSPHQCIQSSDDELSWLIGYIVGDGSIDKTGSRRDDRIRLYDQRLDILERAKQIFEKTGASPCITQMKDSLGYCLSITSAQSTSHKNANQQLRKLFNQILRFFCVKAGGKKFCLDQFNQIPSLAAFVAGVTDAEGYIGQTRTSISMADKDFIENLQQYLALLGVKSHVRVRPPKRNKDKSVMYELTYANAWNRLFPTVKKGRLPKADRHRARSEIVKAVHTGEKDEIFYDFTVKNNHNYIAFNGNAFVVIHNTGMNFSTLRPRGSVCKTTQSRSSGAIGFQTDIGYQSANICQGGNRSGANMGCLEDWHPDLYEFIHHKSKHNWENIRRFATIESEDAFAYFQWENAYEWQTFNVSTLLSDAFMEQVLSEDESPWTVHWKDTEWFLWDFKNPVGPKTGKTYEKYITVTAPDEDIARHKAAAAIPFFNAQAIELERVPYTLTAKEWFRKIAQNAWEDGCPGVIFMDLARKFHNGEYFNPLSATNPCAEQFLPDNSVCALQSLCLPSFFLQDSALPDQDGFQYGAFKTAIHQAVRGLDNLTDITKTGQPNIDENVLRERRIGLGTTGIGELLILMGLRYDTDAARNFTANILEFLRDEAYRASIELAKERGPFPAFDYKGFSQSAFFKTLPKDIRAGIKEFGLRNVTILTQAPTGTSGTMVGYSQGCEPYFMLYFQRNSRVGTFIDGSPAFRVWLEENGIDYSEYDYSLAKLREEWIGQVPNYFVEAQEIHWKDHLKMQAVFAKYVDSSVSKTINLPKEATVEDVEEAFLMAYKLGIKSTTIYRDGSKQQILEAIKTDKKEHRPDRITDTMAPERPKKLLCDIHHTSVKGEKWTVLVGKLGKRPYEVFCAPQDSFELSGKYKEGTIIRSASKKYDLDLGDFKLKNITRLLETDEHRVITRLLSMALRHGVPIDFMNDQLHKADGTVSDFSKAVLRILRKYQDVNRNGNGKINCPICGSKNTVIVSGCPQCLDCNWSKCE